MGVLGPPVEFDKQRLLVANDEGISPDTDAIARLFEKAGCLNFAAGTLSQKPGPGILPVASSTYQRS